MRGVYKIVSDLIYGILNGQGFNIPFKREIAPDETVISIQFLVNR